jgi:hypothetical protein
MKPFRENNKKKRIRIPFILIFTLSLLLLSPIIGCRQISNQFGKPKSMEIEVPENNENAKIHQNKPDSTLSAYLFKNDSIILVYDTKIVHSEMAEIDKYLIKKDFKYLLVKNNDDVKYESIVCMLDKIKKAKIKFWAIGDFNQKELDSIVRERK